MAGRDPILTVDKNQQEANDKHDMEVTVQASDGPGLFKGERTSHIYAEATRNTRHGGASRAILVPFAV